MHRDGSPFDLPFEVYLQQGADGGPTPVAWGLRCAEAIEEGQVIGIYLGLVCASSEVDKASDYVLDLSHFFEAIRHSSRDLKEVRRGGLRCVCSVDGEQPV